jgi:predicted nucleotidyltransferase
MKLEPDRLIAGQKPKVVRDILRDLGRSDCFYIEGVIEHLKKEWWRDYIDELIGEGRIPADARALFRRGWERTSQQDVMYGTIKVRKMPSQRRAAKALIDHLVEEGFVEPTKGFGGRAAYCCTKKGNALRMAGFVPRLDRDKADVLLKEVLGRVESLNRNAELLFWITEVRVFGSYLTDSADLGDIDLAIKMERDQRVKQWADACLSLAKESGKTFSNYLNKLCYPEQEVLRRIKNRSPYVSVHFVEELDRNPEMGGKTIYTFAPPY